MHSNCHTCPQYSTNNSRDLGSWFQIIVVGYEAEQLRSWREASEEAVHTVVSQGAESAAGNSGCFISQRLHKFPKQCLQLGNQQSKCQPVPPGAMAVATQSPFQEVICHTPPSWLSNVWKQLNLSMFRLFVCLLLRGL